MIKVLDAYEANEIYKKSDEQKMKEGAGPGDLVNVSAEVMYGSLCGFILEFDIRNEDNRLIRKTLHVDLGEVLESGRSGFRQGIKAFYTANEFNGDENVAKVRGTISIINEKQYNGEFKSRITNFVPEWVEIKRY